MVDKIRLLPDVPWGEGLKNPEGVRSQDGLRFHHYAEILGRAALDTPEPFTIGVYGDWGSGKTSLMRMMKKVVDDEDEAVSVWFNAWRYEKEEHLIIPLLSTIIAAMTDQKSKWNGAMKAIGEEVLNTFRSVLYGVSVKAEVGVPHLTKAELALSSKDMIDRHEAIKKMATDELLESSLYFRAFSKLDEAFKEGKGPRIVIFVDDLDRCFPDRAVALLEGIKLVLNQPNVAFVLGVAPEIVQAYVRSKYQRDYQIPPEHYEDYLEKLVQLAFRIPDVGESVEEYVRGLLGRRDVFVGIDAEDCEALVPICGPACKDNPRAIVRFLNRLLIMTKVHEAKEREKLERNENTEPLRISLVHFGITNALGLKWPEILEACEEGLLVKAHGDVPGEPSQAREICPFLLELFASHEEENQSGLLVLALRETRSVSSANDGVLNSIASDKSLRKLLMSKPGREWLENPKLRKAAEAVRKEVGNEGTGGMSVKGTGSILSAHTKILNQGVKAWNKWREDNPKAEPDLREADLREADLDEADLDEANLGRAHLNGANLNRAHLNGANLCDAVLNGANLRGANLSRADLSEAYLIEANLSGADLSWAKLNGANLTGADLTGADLTGIRYWKEIASIMGADLRNVQNPPEGFLDSTALRRKT
jgi:KAP-like P-loop domain-containing protein/pentapeptide repeat protein